MNRRNLIKSLAATVLAGGTIASPLATAATAAPDEVPSAPAKGKGLSVGQTLRHDEDLAVTFLAVLKDTRCPMEAKCIAAGKAVVSLRIKVGKQKARIVSLSTLGKDRRIIPLLPDAEVVVGIPKTYAISIASISPERSVRKKLIQADYRLKLKVQVAQ
ncbi:MAG: hypothetical protein EOP87_14910 [Verrucomicrobiaceae bacterium]|nr:MAG: hypothetical protein EOP87_14910 [Verrucomicrobiaceae bacterium]